MCSESSGLCVLGGNVGVHSGDFLFVVLFGLGALQLEGGGEEIVLNAKWLACQVDAVGLLEAREFVLSCKSE